MTILELLLALALLGGLTIACVTWTTSAMRALTAQGGDAAWRLAAEESLAYLDDLFRTDAPAAQRVRADRRVRVEGSSIRVRSRQPLHTEPEGPRVSESVEISLAEGVLVAAFLDAEQRFLAQRPLLGGTRALEVRISEIDTGSSRVEVALTSLRGTLALRSWRLASEDLR
ncbi:MAG: hypothetical protein IT431_12845 [Phycisphaerales bacterium]|nr:hypothetical protein [Phycisphaerales bacterium]